MIVWYGLPDAVPWLHRVIKSGLAGTTAPNLLLGETWLHDSTTAWLALTVERCCTRQQVSKKKKKSK